MTKEGRLEEYYSFSEKDTFSTIIQEFRSGKSVCVSKGGKAEIINKFDKAISGGRFALSINLFLFGLIYFKEDILDHIKRKGLFRYSRYVDKKCILDRLCLKILSISNEINLDIQTVTYLNSIVNMAPVLGVLRKRYFNIIKEIVRLHKRAQNASPRTSFMRTILIFVDRLFLIDYQTRQHENPNAFSFYSKESICEAAATLIFLYRRRYEDDPGSIGVADEEYLNGKAIIDLLKEARHFRDLQDYEIYIDLFSYNCTKDNNTIHLHPEFPSLEKTIRMGFIKTDLQKYYSIRESLKKDERSSLLSLEELTDRFIASSKSEIFEYEDSRGYPRYILKIPDSLVSMLIEINKSDRVFKEEQDLINHSLYEYLINFADARALPLTKDLNLFEFLKIKRFLDVLACIIFNKYRKIPEDRREIFIRSLVPIMGKPFLYKLSDHPAARQKIDSFLDILSWRPEQDIIFDLQYQPFVPMGDFYLIPTNIFLFLNVIRNIFALEHRYQNPAVLEDGRIDLLGDLLTSVFREKGYLTAQKIEYKSKRAGEIDFIAIRDDFMFIAECKRSLLPTGLYEIRRLYDYLKKGDDQLDYLIDAMKDQGVIKEVGDKIGYDLGRISQIKTAIITNNRLFVGYRIGNHPIRNIQEICNIISSGIIKTENGEFSVWKGDVFTPDDLQYYLDDEFYRYQYDSMVPKSYIYDFGEVKFSFSTFHLDQDKFKENIIKNEKKYRRIHQTQR